MSQENTPIIYMLMDQTTLTGPPQPTEQSSLLPRDVKPRDQEASARNELLTTPVPFLYVFLMNQSCQMIHSVLFSAVVRKMKYAPLQQGDTITIGEEKVTEYDCLARLPAKCSSSLTVWQAKSELKDTD